MARELLGGWGRTSTSAADVIRPTDRRGVEAAVAGAPARGTIARGVGHCYGDAAQNAGGTVIATPGLEGVAWADQAAGVVRVAGGTTLDALMRFLVPQGWVLPVTPGTRHATVGGCVAADVHGKNHHIEGGFAAHVTGFTLATAGGVATVDPEGDPELFWATAGGLGLTGVVLEATIRCLPLKTSSVRVVTERGRDLDQVMALMAAGDRVHRYSVAWIDALAGGAALGRGVVSWGDHAVPADLAPARRTAPLTYTPAPGRAVPGWVPGGLLKPVSVEAFNRLVFRRAAAVPATTIEPLDRFLYPLDAVAGWNRLYGPAGFVQYHFVVPFDAGAVVQAALERLGRAGCGSFLAVLKRLGPASPGPLSFPMPGWTLALDVPTGTPGLGAVLDVLDELVADAGGRVYLAKDARLRPELVGVMYPGLDRWRQVRRRVDPGGVFTSDLARRLGLVGPRGGA